MKQPPAYGAFVRWGVLSTANIARKVVGPAIVGSSNGLVAAVASRSADKAAEVAEQLGAERHYGDYDALLADDTIDAVYIALPNALHVDWTIRALNAGKHVLCEKPLGLSANECRRMAATAEKSGRALMEAFMYRFHPRMRAILDCISAGEIGAVQLVRANFSFAVRRADNIRFDPHLGGGSLRDVGCYCVNVARTILGAEPAAAQAYARWSERGVDLAMAGSLAFEGGAVAQVYCALDIPRQEALEVVGSEGRLTADAAFLPGAEPAQFTLHWPDRPPESRTSEGVDQYQLMVQHFADRVLEGAPVMYGPLEAAANAAVIEALHRSARQGGALEEVY